MKIRSLALSALALSLLSTSRLQTIAQFTNVDGVVITNGVIVITTRSANDAFWRQQSSSALWDGDDAKGPGFSPGDSAMGELLQDNGYSVRMLPEKALWDSSFDWFQNPVVSQTYYNGGGGPSSATSNALWSAVLVIMSGSGSGADMVPPNTNRIPIMSGEHSTLGDSTVGVPASHAELFMYGNKTSANLGLSAGLYMKVVATNHPIMKGIPLDSQGRVKIFRDPYPEETLHNISGGKSNYEISWAAVDISAGKSVPAPGLTVLGVLDSNNSQAVFAAMEAGGDLADTSDLSSPWAGYAIAPSRMVHFFVNEQGSGGIRRCFNALTVWGRILFLRSCKWAMGETLDPYQSLNILDLGLVGPNHLRLRWQGSIHNNYRIDGTTDFANWQPIVDSILGGTNGVLTRDLDISAAPQAVYMRLAALP